MLARVLDGSAGAALTLAREWDLEGGLPRIGTLLPVQDHHGNRLATVRVTRVTVLAFSEVDAESASAAMGEPTTVEAWHADRWRFYESCRSEIAVLLGETDWRPARGRADGGRLVRARLTHSPERRSATASGRS